jgi:hypothetical protein
VVTAYPQELVAIALRLVIHGVQNYSKRQSFFLNARSLNALISGSYDGELA